MNSTYNQAIICMAHAIVLNNAGGTARALMDAGYEKKTYLDACEMELLLLQVYLCDRKEFFRIMGNIPWNHGENRTNAPAIKDKLIALSNLKHDADNKGDWWNHLLILMNV